MKTKKTTKKTKKNQRSAKSCVACGRPTIKQVTLRVPSTGEELVYDLPPGYVGRQREELSATQRDYPFEDAFRSGFIRKMYGVVGGQAKEDLQKIMQGVRELETAWEKVWSVAYEAAHARDQKVETPAILRAFEYLGVTETSLFKKWAKIMPLEVTRVPAGTAKWDQE